MTIILVAVDGAFSAPVIGPVVQAHLRTQTLEHGRHLAPTTSQGRGPGARTRHMDDREGAGRVHMRSLLLRTAFVIVRRVHRGQGRADGRATTSPRTSVGQGHCHWVAAGALHPAQMAVERRPHGRVAGGERGAPLRMRSREGRGILRSALDLRGAAEAATDPAMTAALAAWLRNAKCWELRSQLLGAAAAGAGEEAAESLSAEKLLLASWGLLDGRTRAAPERASPAEGPVASIA